MRIDRSVLSLVKRGSAIALVAVTTGCPDATPKPVAPVVGPTPVAPVTSADPGPITSPAPIGRGRRKVENPACGGKHEGMQKCPHCDYCPPCGGG